MWGDSISTYEGYNPQGYAVFYTEERQHANEMNSVYDTWWAKVNQYLKGYLCVNNSYSGSRVTGEFPSASSDARLTHLHNSFGIPDLILIYMGMNDFGNGVKIKSSRFWQNDALSFEESYNRMLKKIKKNYPNSAIICGTLMRTSMSGNPDWIFPEKYSGVLLDEYNSAICRVCKKRGCHIADLANSNLRYDTLDGTHPTAKGHKTLADAWISCINSSR